MFDEIQCLPGGIAFIGLVNKLLVVGRLFRLDISVIECHNDIKTNILFLVSSSISQLVLLDIVDHFLRSQYLSQFEYLIDLIVAHQEGCLLEDLS